MNSNSNHKITATYEWHPGLPNEDVYYELTIRVDDKPVNISSYTITSKAKGASFKASFLFNNLKLRLLKIHNISLYIL